ncbi:hypothetical protein [Microbacterium luticocti]|uniref:hypothetical protein n=1 Tax=Microbacterium luticocti TaxID=451764 RepID=UPI0012EC69B0|nr:hypothetical protein [Microbacterium luticocti]
MSAIDPDFGKNMKACLQEAGFDVSITEDGDIKSAVPSDQLSVFRKARAKCEAEFGYDKPPEQTTAQKKKLYHALVSLADCLESQGYAIAQRPSEQAFLDGAIFDPYGEVLIPRNSTPPSDDEYKRLLKLCPYP